MNIVTDWQSISFDIKNTSCFLRRAGNTAHLLITYCEFIDKESEANELARIIDEIVQPENIFPKWLKCENVTTNLVSKKIEYDTIMNKYLVSVKWERKSSPIEGWEGNN
jgi:hypothetical protein